MPHEGIRTPPGCLKEDAFRDIWKAIDTVRNSTAWKLGFWIMVVFFTIAIPSIVTAVVANDRLRVSSDDKIREKVAENKATIQGINEKLNYLSTSQSRIEVKLDKLLEAPHGSQG